MKQEELLKRAKKCFVGGSVAEYHLPLEVEMIVSHGKGSKLYDIKGKEYVDCVLGSGPLILGHCHPAVVEAVEKQIKKGSTFYYLNEATIQLGEKILKASPCAEKVKFATTGSEAVLYSLRMARAFTGREKILRFEGAFHGGSDIALHGWKPAKLSKYPEAIPDVGGIPKSVSKGILVSPFNDIKKTEEIIEKHKNELAAVIVEPLQRCIRPIPGFLQFLRKITKKHKIILIFDEVVTGFRLAWGGAQERYGVIPDLASYGKTISGGYPHSAIAGREDIMDTVNPLREWYSPKRVLGSGTFNGYAVACAAGLATVNVLEKKGTYERMYKIGDRLIREIEKLGKEFSIPLKVSGEGPVLQILFTKEEKIIDYGSMLRADKNKAYIFGIEMIKHGIFFNPYEKIYLSAVHTDEDISKIIEATRKIFKQGKISKE